MRLQEAIGRELRARRHTALLLAIVALFAVRPFFGDTGAAAIAFSLAILLVLLVALLTIQVDDLVGEREVLLVQRRRRSFVGWALAVLAVAERLWVSFAPNRRLLLVASFSWLLFLVYITWSQLRSLLKQREVTGETISMSISIYLLLGMCWGLLYIVIFTRHPDAFSFGSSSGVSEQHVFPIFIYFSLTILSTIGFGDITPLSTAAFGKWHETTHQGFDKFYGFIGGETNQWSSLIFDGVKRIEPPSDPDYHFTTDMADQAIQWVRTQRRGPVLGAGFVFWRRGTTSA